MTMNKYLKYGQTTPLGEIPGFKEDFPLHDVELGETLSQRPSSHSTKAYLFDTDFQSATGRETLAYTGHGNSCSHYYSYFVDRALKGEGTSYIYKPEIPIAT